MPKHIVSAETCHFIHKYFFEWSSNKPDNHLPDKKRFLALQHPAELHYLAHIYNWDDGSTVLEWLLDSEHCTRSTANLLFWRAAPDWYLRCDLDDENSCPSFNLDGFKIIRKVVQKYEDNSFSKYQIGFNPESEIETISEKNPKWSFPSGVYDVIDGIDIMFDD